MKFQMVMINYSKLCASLWENLMSECCHGNYENTFQSKSYISVFFTCQVSACELQPFSCHDLASDMYSQTATLI